MTELREKMIRAMELHDLSKNTQRSYLAAVSGLATFYMQSPDELTREMMEDYFLYLKQDKGRAPTTIGSVITGLRFFYNHVVCQEHLSPHCTFNKNPGSCRRFSPKGRSGRSLMPQRTPNTALF